MAFMKTITDAITGLDKKLFYRYIAIAGACFILLLALIIWQYKSKINSLKKQIYKVNALRDDVRIELSKYEQIQKQRKEVDAILAEEEDFNITGYFDDLVKRLGLEAHVKERTPSRQETEDNYQETMVNATLVDITMQQLTELLNEIEHKARIFTKQIEITRSKKSPTIEVNLTIATLQPKTETTE
jgi:hypothetical protein